MTAVEFLARHQLLLIVLVVAAAAGVCERAADRRGR